MAPVTLQPRRSLLERLFVGLVNTAQLLLKPYRPEPVDRFEPAAPVLERAPVASPFNRAMLAQRPWNRFINGAERVPPAPVRSAEDCRARLNDYARLLGFTAAELAPAPTGGWQLRVVGHDGIRLALGAPLTGPRRDDWSGLLRDAGLCLNQARFALPRPAPVALPERLPDTSLNRFDFDNATWSTLLSQLAYREPDFVRHQLEAWGGFVLDTFAWLDTPQDTQGFVISDEAGNLHVVLRGTREARDWLKDADFFRTHRPWMEPPDAASHGGMAKAVDELLEQGFVDSPRAVDGSLTEAIDVAEALDQFPSGESNPKGYTFAGVMLSGHSLGGGNALGLALAFANGHVQMMAHSHPITVPEGAIQVYVEGAPAIGNDAFVREFQQKLPNSYALVNARDGREDPIATEPLLGARTPAAKRVVLNRQTERLELGDAAAPLFATQTAGTPATLALPVFEAALEAFDTAAAQQGVTPGAATALQAQGVLPLDLHLPGSYLETLAVLRRAAESVPTPATSAA